MIKTDSPADIILQKGEKDMKRRFLCVLFCCVILAQSGCPALAAGTADAAKDSAYQAEDALWDDESPEGGYDERVRERRERIYGDVQEEANAAPEADAAPEAVLLDGETGGTFGEGGALSWSLDSAGTLTISGEGRMSDYDGPWNYPWHEQRNQIQAIVIKDGVRNIGSNAFSSCYSLSHVSILSSITSIGRGAFTNCSSLSNIPVPDSVVSIGSGAFDRCRSLTSIFIPSMVSSIGDRAFIYCSALREITVSLDNSAYSSSGGVLYNKEKTQLLAYPAMKSGKLAIPGSVTSICDNAFSNSVLSNIVIPDNVTEIGEYAFSGCANLTSISIPDSVVSIGAGAFSYCRSLENVTLSNSVAVVEPSTFQECTQLASITIPGSVTSIQSRAFASCIKLYWVSLPD
ncbi:MAG: leucine-rich repeat domain-containing protein, partial [Oscillibacter sp.]|nr:leucine-rich repeat domain-containing protein [Oscillibacter sp.]